LPFAGHLISLNVLTLLVSTYNTVLALGHSLHSGLAMFLADTPAVSGAAPGAPGVPGATDANAPGLLSNLFPFVLMLGGVYFLFIAPQMKRTKAHQKLISELTTGDEIVTTGGVFGVITAVKSDRYVIEIAKGVRVEVRRSHVEGRAAEPADEKSTKDATPADTAKKA
jgi:preprotein translocase subunit YajC